MFVLFKNLPKNNRKSIYLEEPISLPINKQYKHSPENKKVFRLPYISLKRVVPPLVLEIPKAIRPPIRNAFGIFGNNFSLHEEKPAPRCILY